MKFIFNLFLICSIIISYGLTDEIVKPKDIYLSYTSYPKRVFTGQKFDLNLKAVILKDSELYDSIVLTYVDEKDIDILTKEPIWFTEKENIFTTIITCKSRNSNFELPLITVALIKDGKIINHLSIDPPKIKFEKIAVNEELFSNVIANELQINSIKTKQYSNNELMSTINLEASNSNLEDFRLFKYGEQGIKVFEEKYPTQSIYYYVIIPSHKKEIKFTYYNTKLNDFVLIDVPINLHEELVSTQTDLNPYNSSILIYKQILALSFFFFLIILYYFYRKNIFLIFMMILISIITYLFIPNEKIILAKDSKIYILPTKNSTVYKILDRKELVEIINTKDHFTKVLFSNQTIGWINKNDNR